MRGADVAEHPGCEHPVEYMSIATYGGWERFPMICFKCIEERHDQGLCQECGSEDARIHLSGEEDPSGFYVCAPCWRRMNTPQRCEICGRFCGGSAVYVLAGEKPDFYDPYWGLQPPEPVGAVTCGRLSCRNRVFASAHLLGVCGEGCPYHRRRQR